MGDHSGSGRTPKESPTEGERDIVHTAIACSSGGTDHISLCMRYVGGTESQWIEIPTL